ncbi:hypothetical protein QFW77_18520 [Luteimonas sp. RD2P54]|uniref:Uncharacterized protein n=1 Tax=Luteimonas endophytica TaxID=3042023 RepID=A0ABT6JDR7_9GAMM|nr:hypothetical protein [Luteimonas endophytica]MDH5824965.1 hypothetical protein [Luteimonas endophytica]
MSLDIGSVASRAIEAFREQAAPPPTDTATAPTCGCGPEANPGYPAKPQTDPGAGVHGSQPWYARGDDVAFEQVAGAAATAADALGYTNAARHLDHYLGNSGEDLTVDPARIARDVPQFSQSVEQQLDAQVNAAIEQAVADGCYGEPIAFDSGWQGFYIGKDMSADWFYAMGGIQHSVTGTVVVTPGDPPTAEVSYQTHVFDRYNWDGGKQTTIGPVTITDQQMGELHTAGLAQEYDIVGSSGEGNYTATYDPAGGSTGNPGVPEAGDRDGERSDPGR